MLPVQRAVRRDVRNRLVPRPIVPIPRGREDDVSAARGRRPGARSGRAHRDSRCRSSHRRRLRIERCLLADVRVDRRVSSCRSMSTSLHVSVADPRPRAWISHDDCTCRENHQIDRFAREQSFREIAPSLAQRRPPRARLLIEIEIQVRHRIAAHHHRNVGGVVERPRVRERAVTPLREQARRDPRARCTGECP